MAIKDILDFFCVQINQKGIVWAEILQNIAPPECVLHDGPWVCTHPGCILCEFHPAEPHASATPAILEKPERGSPRQGCASWDALSLLPVILAWLALFWENLLGLYKDFCSGLQGPLNIQTSQSTYPVWQWLARFLSPSLYCESFKKGRDCA
jgi:hypothetical protein